MSDLYSLAGQGRSNGAYNIGSGIGSTLSTIGAPLMFASPLAGGAMMGLGALSNLIMGPIKSAAEKRRGEELFSDAQRNFESKIAKHPSMYSTSGITSGFNRARSSIQETNSSQTNALLDRYNSLQRKQMANRIRSGLASGAAQAASIQNNVAFQRTANDLFNKQGQMLSNLALRESQAKMNMQPIIAARKEQAARKSLMSQGIVNPSALGGLTNKIYEGEY